MSKKQILGGLKTEEMYIKAESKSRELGMRGMIGVGFCIWLYDTFTGADSTAILLVLLTGITISYWVKYRMMREKSDLIWAIVGTLGWLGALGNYML